MKIDRTVRVELTHEDIEQAIRNHIAAQVPGISDFKLDIFDASAPTLKGDSSKYPLLNLEAAAEIELVQQPTQRPKLPGDRNPLPFGVDPAQPGKDRTILVGDSDFKRQFSDAAAQRSDNLD